MSRIRIFLRVRGIDGFPNAKEAKAFEAFLH